MSTDEWTSDLSRFRPQNPRGSGLQQPNCFSPSNLREAVSITGSDLLATSETFPYCEEMIGMFRLSHPLPLATTFTPKPFFRRPDLTFDLNPSRPSRPDPPLLRYGAGAPQKALESSLARLGTSRVKLYSLDMAPSLFSGFYLGGKGAAIKGMVRCKARRLTSFLGVKNVRGGRRIRSLAKRFAAAGAPLDAVSVDFSIDNISALLDGTLNMCRELGIAVLATRPLGVNSIASGHYTASNPTGGEHGRPMFSFQQLDKVLPLHEALKQVGRRVMSRMAEERDGGGDGQTDMADVASILDEGINPTTVAINYVIAKGCIAMPTCVSAREAAEVRAARKWSLNKAEEQLLDEAAKLHRKGGKRGR
jgi:aryl-alcohol dehydrogenase-like predicted oxidoreductase